MAKKKTKGEDLNGVKSEFLVQLICEACEKARLPTHDIISVLLASITDVTFMTMNKEHSDENFEIIAEFCKKKILEGLKIYREMEEKENGNENK